MRLQYQLFLALLAGAGLLIGLLAILADHSFNRGFLGYVNRIEQQRLTPLRHTLTEGYAREGDWRWITDRADTWRALLEVPGNATPRFDAPTGQRSRAAGAQRGHRGPSPLLGDAEQRVLAGRHRPGERVDWQPLIVDERVVGHLGVRPFKQLPQGIEQAFARQQRTSFLIATAAMLPVSALLAWLLTNRIAYPLTTLNAAVGRISRGDFGERLPARRRDEIGELSRNVNQLAASLESNLDARRRWLAEISHELRTPVAVLQAELEAMQDGVIRVDDAALASLHSEATRLSRLIDDLHQLTLSDAGALDYRMVPLDLAALLEERLEGARLRIEEAGLTQEPGQRNGSVPIVGDAQRLAQLLDNLLQNSLRYTDTGGRIRASVQRDGTDALLRWADSAPGVAEQDLPRLFDPLYRVEASRQRASGGSGLGLAIAARIAQAHGGSISAAPAPLGGLALTLRLPLADTVVTGAQA